MATQGSVPALELIDATKSFFGVTVLDHVDLSIGEGEIHALLGQNGSGKSTLIKILSGFYVPSDVTRLRIQGEDVRLPYNKDPLKHGIAFVHQNLGLVDELSIIDNMSVGEYEMHGRLGIDWKKQRELVSKQLNEFGVTEDPSIEVGDLSSPAQKALVAIARAVYRIRSVEGKGILVLDEPTVYLPRDEVEHLQDVVRRLAATGVGVLYVTHRLDELKGFADRATVIRDGRKVGEVVASSAARDDLVEMITGSPARRSGREAPPAQEGRKVLSVSKLTGGRASAVSFDANAGEILGLAGLVGMGQDDVLAMTFGASRRESGEVLANGTQVPANPSDAIKAGLAFLPSDRPRLSAAMSESVAANITLPVLKDFFFKGGRLHKRAEATHVELMLEALDVRPRVPDLEIERFSGGNQQKALLAKWLQFKPQILLLDEPVQGVDVGAKAQIFDRLRAIAAEGCAVVIASSEYEDLANLCTRVLIFVDGQIADVLTGSDVTKEVISAACFASTPLAS